MIVDDFAWTVAEGWTSQPSARTDLGLYFGARSVLEAGSRFAELRDLYPGALGAGYRKLGFYPYGEISPHRVTGRSVLHNQTMTVTTLAEAA